MAKNYDAVILGGGVAGYTAALQARQFGLSAAVVEASRLGGTCLHKGCIPTKALLRSAEVYQLIGRHAAFGVAMDSADVSVDFAQMQSRKQSIVAELYAGLQQLVRRSGVDMYAGRGRIMGPSIFSPTAGALAVDMHEGGTEYLVPDTALLIATGSRPQELSGLPIDGTRVVTTDQLLELKALPASIVIVGGGVIGSEWASLLVDLDVDVTLIEMAPQILPYEDRDVQRAVARELAARGVKIHTQTKVLSSAIHEHEVSVECESDEEARRQFAAELVLVSVGRRPSTEGIGLEAAEILVQNGAVVVNEAGETSVPGIFAAGDVVGGLMLAHKAAQQAVEVVRGWAGVPVYAANMMPRCVYTRPEAASVGLTEKQAHDAGYRTLVGRYAMKANGKALIEGDPEGFCKIICDADTDDLLGAHLVGARTTDIIGLFSLGGLLDVSGEELAAAVYPHPTISEVVGEAARRLRSSRTENKRSREADVRDSRKV